MTDTPVCSKYFALTLVSPQFMIRDLTFFIELDNKQTSVCSSKWFENVYLFLYFKCSTRVPSRSRFSYNFYKLFKIVFLYYANFIVCKRYKNILIFFKFFKYFKLNRNSQDLNELTDLSENKGFHINFYNFLNFYKYFYIIRLYNECELNQLSL